MKILFISVNSDPFKDVSYGALQRTHLLLAALAKSAQVDVCAFVDSVQSDIEGCHVIFSQHREYRLKLYQSAISRFKALLGKASPEDVYRVNEPMAEIVHRLLESKEYDFIVVRYLQTVAQLALTEYLDRVVVDFDDNPVKAYVIGERIRGGIHRLLPSLRALPVRRAWKTVQGRCAMSFYSDGAECVYGNSRVLHNVPLLHSEDDSPCCERRCLFFVGALDYAPNRDGISHFLGHIWPKLRLRYPDISFRIAGKCSSDALVERWGRYPGVSVLGYVDDIHEEYRRASLVVAPVYYGAGTNIKVLEAASMGRACVTTSAGFNGLENCLPQDSGILVARDDKEFISKISFLLDNPQTALKLAAKAKDAIRESFSAANFERELTSALSQASCARNSSQIHP